jgi:hypothetical protein
MLRFTTKTFGSPQVLALLFSGWTQALAGRRSMLGRLLPRLFGALVLVRQVSAAPPAEADAIVFVADTRALSGWRAWWGNLYNESHAYFTLMTILLIPTVAVILGLLTDYAIGRLGINLRSRHLGGH